LLLTSLQSVVDPSEVGAWSDSGGMVPAFFE